MKKLIALLLAAVMVLSMAACGSDKSDETTTESTEGTTEGTDPTNKPSSSEDGADTTPSEGTDPTEETEPAEPFVPKIGEGVYCKTSYTIANEDLEPHLDQVIATVGEEELTIGELQVYYWMYVYSFLNNYGYYLSYMGLDLTKPLDQQADPDGAGTWEQFFLKEALDSWHTNSSLNQTGIAKAIPMNEAFQEELQSLQADLQDGAKEGKYDSVDAMLLENIGPGTTEERYTSYLVDYYGGYSYYQHAYDSIEVTDEMIEAYFTENEEALAESEITKDSGKLVNVRHILLTPKGGTTGEDGSTTYSDEEWKACETEAQGILDQWLAGEKTEESFAALANEHSTDPGSNTNGGLYENVKTGDMVEEFDAWCFDESRKVGDHGLVKTTYGYHIMFYSGEEAQWKYECRNAILNEKSAEFVEAAAKEYPLEVDFEKIVLGSVNLSGEEE